jgi:hypothetical protein
MASPTTPITIQRRLGIVFVEEAEEQYLAEQLSRQMPFELALREDPNSRFSSGAVLVFGPLRHLRFAARVTRRRRVDDLRTSIVFEDLIETTPIRVDLLRGALLTSQLSPTTPPGGTLTDKAAERVTELLEKQDPALADVVSAWRSLSAAKPAGTSDSIYEQRDATVMLFRIARMRSGLTEPEDPAWQVSEMQKTYLAGAPREDPAIVADACSFLGWRQEAVDGWAARSFSDGAGSRLTIANINRQLSESVTGADLVYYHVQRGSFVHVQYKRMRRLPGATSGSVWCYDEDAHFGNQLESLVQLDKKLAVHSAASGEYRLSPETGYFKFTKMDDFRQGDAALVPGQYMSASLLQGICSSKGGRLGRLRTDTPGSPYLTNTLFGDLVGYGLIGSRGAGHRDVAETIRSLAAAKESVVIGIHSEETKARRVRETEARPSEDGVSLAPLLSGSASKQQPHPIS